MMELKCFTFLSLWVIIVFQTDPYRNKQFIYTFLKGFICKEVYFETNQEAVLIKVPKNQYLT